MDQESRVNGTKNLTYSHDEDVYRQPILTNLGSYNMQNHCEGNQETARN